MRAGESSPDPCLDCTPRRAASFLARFKAFLAALAAEAQPSLTAQSLELAIADCLPKEILSIGAVLDESLDVSLIQTFLKGWYSTSVSVFFASFITSLSENSFVSQLGVSRLLLNTSDCTILYCGLQGFFDCLVRLANLILSG